ncbi:MAG: ferritin family protein [Desulfobacteraceae bacterium]|jgi:rubrerythrin|nr:ferritin family protein [Desulfobacteraceae bacterium]
MTQDKALEILKQAILLERRGKSFYAETAKAAENQAVREFFLNMASEEERHIAILSEQFKSYTATGRFRAGGDADTNPESVAKTVLPSELQKRISAAGVEAAAVSAAMAMEERAVRLYAARSEEASDEAEKALYQWLARWETQHLETLAELDRALTETIWNDNSFWPF